MRIREPQLAELALALALLAGSAGAAIQQADRHLSTFHGAITKTASSHHWLQIHTSTNTLIRFQTRYATD